MWDQFITDDYEAALRVDQLATTHPLHVTKGVDTPGDINELFDSTTAPPLLRVSPSF